MFHSHHRFVTVLSCSIGVVSTRQTKNSMEDNLPRLEHHLGCALQLAVTDSPSGHVWLTPVALQTCRCSPASTFTTLRTRSLVAMHSSGSTNLLLTTFSALSNTNTKCTVSRSSMSWSLSSRGNHTTLFDHCTPVVCIAKTTLPFLPLLTSTL